MTEDWKDVVTELWNVTNEMLDDMPTAVLSEGGAVVLEINPQRKEFNVSLVLKELSKKDVEEYRKALAEGKTLIFYYTPNTDNDDNELEVKSIILKGKKVNLEGAIEEINAHIRQTGGVSLPAVGAEVGKNDRRAEA